MPDYPVILKINYPGKQCVLSGESYEGLDWHDESPKPTQNELDALWEFTQAQVEAEAKAKIDAKQSALAKLMTLGLTEEESLAIGVK